MTLEKFRNPLILLSKMPLSGAGDSTIAVPPDARHFYPKRIKMQTTNNNTSKLANTIEILTDLPINPPNSTVIRIVNGDQSTVLPIVSLPSIISGNYPDFTLLWFWTPNRWINLGTLGQLRARQPGAQKESRTRLHLAALPDSLPQQTSALMSEATRVLCHAGQSIGWTFLANSEGKLQSTDTRHFDFSLPVASLNRFGAGIGDQIAAHLRELGAPCAYFFNILMSWLRRENGRIQCSAGDLLKVTGLSDGRETVAERAQLEEQIDHWLFILSLLEVRGLFPGRFIDPRNSEKNKMITYEGRFFGYSRYTVGRTKVYDVNVAQHYLPILLDPSLSTDFGDLLKLRGLPFNKVSGAWALSIALGLNQRWRGWAAKYANCWSVNGEIKIKFKYTTTREELLGQLFLPAPDFRLEKILGTPEKPAHHAARALDYWADSLKLLRGCQFLPALPRSMAKCDARAAAKNYEVGEPPPGRGGAAYWQAWLRLPLHFSPNQNSSADIQLIAQRGKAVRSRAKRKA